MREKGSSAIIGQWTYRVQASLQPEMFKHLRLSRQGMIEIRYLQCFLMQKYRPWKEKIDTILER